MAALFIRGKLLEAGNLVGPQWIMEYYKVDDWTFELIVFIESHVKEQAKKKKEAEAKKNNGDRKT